MWQLERVIIVHHNIHDLIDSHKSGGTVRVSVGYFNTEEDIDLLLDGIRSL